MRADAAGVLRTVPATANLDAEVGTRVAPGRVQLGLTDSEIDAIEERRKELLRRIDVGELALF